MSFALEELHIGLAKAKASVLKIQKKLEDLKDETSNITTLMERARTSHARRLANKRGVMARWTVEEVEQNQKEIESLERRKSNVAATLVFFENMVLGYQDDIKLMEYEAAVEAGPWC